MFLVSFRAIRGTLQVSEHTFFVSFPSVHILLTGIFDVLHCGMAPSWQSRLPSERHGLVMVSVPEGGIGRHDPVMVWVPQQGGIWKIKLNMAPGWPGLIWLSGQKAGMILTMDVEGEWLKWDVGLLLWPRLEGEWPKWGVGLFVVATKCVEGEWPKWGMGLLLWPCVVGEWPKWGVGFLLWPHVWRENNQSGASSVTANSLTIIITIMKAVSMLETVSLMTVLLVIEWACSERIRWVVHVDWMESVGQVCSVFSYPSQTIGEPWGRADSLAAITQMPWRH